MARRVLSGELNVQEAAEEFLVSQRTVWKWVGRFQQEGLWGMADRSSRPRRCPRQIAVSATAAIEALRRKRMTGGRIARQLGVSRATVYRVIRRRRLSRLTAIDPPVPAQRYEHAWP